MAQMSTTQLMDAALAMIGATEAPADSVIDHPGTRIGHVLVGLDVDVAELFMARQLGYHAVLAYHPNGTRGRLARMDAMQHGARLLALGMDEAKIRALLDPRITRLQRAEARMNPDRAGSVARLLDLPFLTIHSPFGEVARRTIQATVDAALAAQPDATLRDLCEFLDVLAPFGNAPRPMPRPHAGWEARAGRVVVALGTYAPPDAAIARAYFAQGVQTLCVADFAEADWHDLAQDELPGNIFILGEAASASVGILPYVADLRAQGIEVTTFAGVLGDASTP